VKHDLSLPPPGTFEPEVKPSKDVKLGQKPVLPPPQKPLDEAAVTQAIQNAENVPPVIPPPLAQVPPPNLKVDPGAMPKKAAQPMRREPTRSSVSKVKKKPKRQAAMMDDEVAVVTRDPRKPRGE
jgi:hypothetical protein